MIRYLSATIISRIFKIHFLVGINFRDFIISSSDIYQILSGFPTVSTIAKCSNRFNFSQNMQNFVSTIIKFIFVGTIISYSLKLLNLIPAKNGDLKVTYDCLGCYLIEVWNQRFSTDSS